MTDYLKLARDVTPPPAPADPSNPYLALVQDEQRQAQARARSLLETALKDNPDTAAERLRLSKTSGLPLRVVENNLDDVRIKEQARAVDLVKLAQQSPVLSRQLLDPTFTQTSVDDLDTLSKIENTVAAAARYVMGADGKGGLLRDIPLAATDVALGATAGVGELIFNIAGTAYDLVGWKSGAREMRGRANASSEARQSFGLQPESDTGKAVKAGLGSAGTNLAILPIGLERGLFQTAEAAGSAVAGIMGAGVGADAYLKAREAGKTQVDSALFGVPQGAFEFLFEKIPASKLFGDIAANTSFVKTLRNQLGPEVVTEQLTTLAQDFNEWMNLNPDKTVGQFIAERPDAAYQTLIATLVGVGVQTTTITAINKAVEKATDTALSFQQDMLAEQMKLVNSSMLRQRSPEQFRAYVERVIGETENAKKEVYVDAEVLSQLPQDVLAQLPASVREALPEALAINATVAVPMADVLSVAPGTPLEEVLNDHARLTPDAMTRKEAEKAGEVLQREAETIMQQAADQETARQEFEAIKTDLAQQVTQAGRYSPAVADAYAAGLTHFFVAYGARTGLGAKGLYDAYRARGFRIAGQPSTQDNTLEEGARPGTISVDAYHFSKAARPMLSTAFFGTGLKGSARDEIMSNPDTRLQKRLSFYFDKGTGVRPEAGVGGIAHRARLSNIYDANADVLGLRSGDARAFESKLIDLGYSGYADRLEGTQPGQVVLLGDQAVEPELLGPVSQIQTGEVLPALPREEAAWQTIAEGDGAQARMERMQANPAWSGYEMRIEGNQLQARKKGGVFEQRAENPVPPRVAEVADIANARTIAGTRKWPTNRDFKLALQAAVRAVTGTRDLTKDTPEVRAYLVRQLLKEAREALVTNSNAVGWYDEKVTTALEVVSAIHPELKTDEQSRFAFTWALAVTSNGVKVNKNFELAERAYTYWKANGVMPTANIGVGTAASKIHEALATYNDLIQRWGYERFKAFATTLQPNRDVLAAFGRKVSGEGMDAQVYGAGVVGPKIGNGFFMNLYGEFGQLTMDRWWVRMWGRLTGDLVVVDRQAIAESRAAFVSIVEMIKADKAATKVVEQAIKTRLGKGDPIAMAKAIMKATAKKEVRDTLATVLPATPEREAAVAGVRKIKDFISIGDELRKAAKGYYMTLDGQIEVPGGSKRRDMMRAVSQSVLAELQKDQPSLTMADFQALMWYPEKTLYDSAGAQSEESEEGYEDDEAPDYANAAIGLARQQGVSDDAINAAVERARSGIQARQRAGRSGRGTGDVPPAGSAGPGDPTFAQDGDLNGQAGNRAGRYSSGGLAPLEGAPTVAGATGPDARLVAVAEQYARENGIVLRRQAEYVKVDPERAARIAAAYEAMRHAPNDPAVREAYEDLQRQVLAQYLALERAGYRFYFFDETNDPYQGNPWNAMRDLRANQTMAVFATEAGFGTSEFDPEGNPLLGDTGLEWGFGSPDGQKKRVLFNDLFRAVHDAFGHGLEGAGFRAEGEENAWQAHARLFTGPALGALTSETRGQNSWLNYGPNGETNRTAKVEDTVFADQKTGLMPNWTWTEGRAADASDTLEQAAYHGTPYRGIDRFSLDKIGTGEGAQAYGWGLYFASAKEIAEFYRKKLAGNREWTDAELAALPPALGNAEFLELGALGRKMASAGNLPPNEMARWRELKTVKDVRDEAVAKATVGQTYVVELPEADELLDYDAPLKDQPEKVRKALEGLGVPLTVYNVVDASGNVVTSQESREKARLYITKNNVAGKVVEAQSDLDGQRAYKLLTRKLGSDKAASLALRDAGIPGLRYLDANSRGAQADGKNYNFVIFDEGRIQKTGELYQQARGTFNPKTLELVLNPNTDLTTLWHEMGHFFLEVMADVAAQPNAPAQIATDWQTFLSWAGVTDQQWRAFSLDQKRDVHEKWARAFEQYVMEGKVPNKELLPLMRRFAAWFKATYQSIQRFLAQLPAEQRPEINDDIRRVMDRMLATDEQITEANEAAGLLPDEESDAEANDRLRKRSMADLKWTVRARDKVIRQLQKKAKDTRKAVEAEVRAEADAMPAFAAAEALDKATKAHEADPLSADLNTAVIADAFGFPSVDAMYRAIEQAGAKQDYIDGRAEQRMLEEHGDLMNEDAIRQAANEAVHNEARARSLATELRTQSEMLNPRDDTGKTNSKGQRVTVNALVEAAKQFAANVVGRTPLRDLKNRAWQHTAAERRAAKAWQQATAKGATADAVKAKQDQMLNHAAAKAAIDAQAEGKKILEFFARVTKGNDETVVEKGRDPDVVNAARAVLALYGVQTPASKNAAAYLETLKRNDPEMWAVIEPMVQEASANAQPMLALTVDELRGLHAQIDGMWYLAKRSRQMEVDGDLMDIEDAADELHARMVDIGIPDTVPGETGALTKAEQRTRSLRFFGAALKRVEQWVEGMDGKYGGPFLRYVFQPIKDAADRYRKDRVVYRRKFQALVNSIAPSMRHEMIEAPELGYTFGRGHNGIGTAELLHALLHTGNDSNKRKLLLGRQWATENADGTLDTSKWDAFIARLVAEGKLTPAHFDFLQGVWDLMEETKPLAQKAHRDVFGRYFAEVTATPFVDPFGASRRGGYVPAQADPEIVPDATMRELAERENESMAYAFPATSRGFTKGRVEYNRPLKLDLRTLPQHLDKVLLFSHMEPAVRSAAKLLRNKGVSQALNRIDPSAYAGTLLPWLNRAAKQIVETPVMGDGKISRVLSVLRARAGAALMFANVSNTVQQITGLSTAAVKVKPAHLMRAAATFIAHPKATREAVWGASPYMADRASNEVSAMNGQLEAILLNPSVYERAQEWSQQHAYFLQTAFDNALSPIVWTGAFNQAVEQGMDDEAAVKFADGVVRQTQGSTLPEDISRIESGPAYARMFTQFVGYFNMMANTNATAVKQIASEVGLRKGAGKALYVVLMGLLVPLWVAEAIAQGFRGGPDDEDKDGYLDDWLAAVFGLGTIKGILAQVPFIGQLGNAAIARTNNNPADDKVSLSPAVSLLEGAAGAPTSVYKAIVEDGSSRKAIRDVASLVSIATGLPATAVARPAGYLADVVEGRTNPSSAVDAVRGTVTGVPAPDTRR